MIDELKGKMEREGLSVYYVAKALGTNWHTVRDWLEGKRKPQPMSLRVIRQFLEG